MKPTKRAKSEICGSTFDSLATLLRPELMVFFFFPSQCDQICCFKEYPMANVEVEFPTDTKTEEGVEYPKDIGTLLKTVL